ncbi:Peptidase family M1 [Spirosomataceae bacterium TFI 002]|nr:Peptidase family M1 [Spirosomataceae bacterium TFI 002]
MKSLSLSFLLLIAISFSSKAQFSRADSLRGTITQERAWWDLTYYELDIYVNPADKSIKGSNEIQYKVLSQAKELQIDLQKPLRITKIEQDGKSLTWRSDGPNAHFVKLEKNQAIGSTQTITVFYDGNPVVAQRAPWDGGVVWSKDSQGNPFVATACQGIGASIWWPCKDHMYDEVDSMRIICTVPDGLWNVANGKLAKMELHPNGDRTTEWLVKNPINNYGVNLNIANYAFWSDTYKGEKGDLPVSFWVLPENLTKAKPHFQDAYRTLEALEHWFGPYPFYEDGYKLVEAPYLGMEHQSSVTYGNGYQKGYKGKSISESDYGTKWDFIIIHESGHEWFANNITYKDIADMWVHEGFTNYSESLFTEYFYGKEAGAEYVRGLRKNISNDKPIIGKYDVNERGSGDMYNKGGNMLHTIRQIINDDEKWRGILRGLNSTFYHQTVTTKQIEDYISKESGYNLNMVFNQYLRSTGIPTLEVKKEGKKVCYKWTNVLPGFQMPLDVTVDGEVTRIYPTDEWIKVKGNELKVNHDYYVIQKNI